MASLEERERSEIMEEAQISSPEERRSLGVTLCETRSARDLSIDSAQATVRIKAGEGTGKCTIKRPKRERTRDLKVGPGADDSSSDCGTRGSATDRALFGSLRSELSLQRCAHSLIDGEEL